MIIYVLLLFRVGPHRYIIDYRELCHDFFGRFIIFKLQDFGFLKLLYLTVSDKFLAFNPSLTFVPVYQVVWKFLGQNRFRHEFDESSGTSHDWTHLFSMQINFFLFVVFLSLRNRLFLYHIYSIIYVFFLFFLNFFYFLLFENLSLSFSLCFKFFESLCSNLLSLKASLSFFFDKHFSDGSHGWRPHVRLHLPSLFIFFFLLFLKLSSLTFLSFALSSGFLKFLELLSSVHLCFWFVELSLDTLKQLVRVHWDASFRFRLFFCYFFCLSLLFCCGSLLSLTLISFEHWRPGR